MSSSASSKSRQNIVLRFLFLPVLATFSTALAFAAFGPQERAAAIAGSLAALGSATAALAAVYLSREALARTDQQLRNTERATVLAQYPLLLPVHESVALPDATGHVAQHLPSLERFRLNAAPGGCYAFLLDSKDCYLVPVENAGKGPALQVAGFLWRADGRFAELVGRTTIAAGGLVVMTARLGVEGERSIPSGFAQELASLKGKNLEDLFWLELRYVDVFSNPLGGNAIFDPSGTGSWRHAMVPSVESSKH